MMIYPDNEKLIYSGRIDWENPKEPVWVFPATHVTFRFTGDSLQVAVRNKHAYWNNYLGCIVDGEQTSIQLPENGEATISVPVKPTENGEHEALIFKRQDSCHELTLLGIELAEGGELLNPPAVPERKIEVYGDSVSAGEVSEAVDYVGKTDPEHTGEFSNSWYSYAWITARKLHAQIHDVAQGGIPLIDGIGWFGNPEYMGMESVWDKVHYNYLMGTPTKWDFSRYTPDVVIVALGQNDSNPDDFMKNDYDGEKAVHWRESYRMFLGKLRATYPEAPIICCTTLLQHDPGWDKAIGEAVKAMNDPKITHYLYKRNGSATPGHLRIPEAEEMATELAAYIEDTVYRR